MSEHPQSADAPIIGTIVCGYSVEELPVAWLRVFHRFEHAVARARWRIRVRLFPIEELPDEVDILVVPPELAERSAALRPDVRIIVTTRERAANAVDALLKELEAGTLRAGRVLPGEPKIVVHRGSDIL